MDRSTRFLIFPLLIATLCLLGCGGGARPVVVGSKNFTEQLILGEIIAQQVEQCAKQPVLRRFQLGGTLLAQQAMRSGEIDVYPEYTGTAWMTVLQQSAPTDPKALLEAVRAAYRTRYGIRWLDPLGFENTFAMAVRVDLAEREQLRTLSDAAAKQIPLRLGVGYEFQQRPDGLDALLATYPLTLRGAPRAMDLGLLYRAIEQGQVDMVAGNSTDGLLDVLGLRVLADDKGFFPPYEAAILLSERVANETPAVARCLEALSGSIDVTTMRELNRQAEQQEADIAGLARRFLQSHRH